MKIEIISKDIEVTTSMQEYIDNLVEEINTYFKLKPSELRLEIKNNHNQFKIKAMIFFKNNKFIRQEQINDDFYICINQLANNLKQQLRKLKAKLDDKNKVDNQEIFNDNIDKDLTKPDIRYKEILLKPMDQEEAMLQLEALGLDYYIYKDLNDDINVIYKRKNGYGVINTK